MDKIPVPTDNIYKFYALFGLVLFIFSIGATIVTTKSANEFMVRALPDLEAAKLIEHPSPVEQAKKALLQRQIEVELSNKQSFLVGLGVVASFGFWAGIYGFRKWHTLIQPVEDEMRTLQRDKLKLEVEKMKAEAAATALASNQPPAPASPSGQSAAAGRPPSH